MSSTSRNLLVWLALPAVVGLSVGAGLLVADWASDSDRPSAVLVGEVDDHGGHDGHVMPDGSTMPHDGHVMPDGSTMPGDEHAIHGAHGGGSDPAEQPSSGPGNAANQPGGHDSHGGGHDAAGAGSTSGPQPRAAVIGTFAGANALVLVAAAVLRRRITTRRRQSVAV